MTKTKYIHWSSHKFERTAKQEQTKLHDKGFGAIIKKEPIVASKHDNKLHIGYAVYRTYDRKVK